MLCVTRCTRAGTSVVGCPQVTTHTHISKTEFVTSFYDVSMSDFDLYILKKYLLIPMLVLCIPILGGPSLQCGSGSLDPYTGLRFLLLLFSSVAFKMRTKNYIFFLVFFCFLHSVGTRTLVVKDNKSLRTRKTVEIKSFLIFLLVDVRSRTNNYG